MPTRTERKEASRVRRRLDDRAEAAPVEADPTRRAKRRGKTERSHRFGLEYRVRPGRCIWAKLQEWSRCWKWYQTEGRRDAALAVLGRSDLFEYRPIER